MLLTTCGYQVELVFVCGHQDQGNPTILTRDMWLNVEADILAKSKATPFDGPHVYKLLGNPWACYTSTSRVIKQFNNALRTWINRQETVKYWEKCKSLMASQVKDVDWHALGMP